MKALMKIAAVSSVCALMLLAPSLAEARAGGGSSLGSRGSKTYQYNNAAPIQRSITPEPAPVRPAQPVAPAYNGGYAAGGYNSHPFLTGLAGGFLGAGLAGMMFGHGFSGGGYGMGGAGFVGMLLQLLLIGGLGYWAYRLFRRGIPASATPGMGGFGTSLRQPLGGGVGGGSAPALSAPITIQDADYEQFSQLLIGIQDAWSHGDINRLRQMVTPEMLSYFGELLAANVSRGVENKVEDVRLLQGDLKEAWEEYGAEYATAHLRFAARDYMVRLGSKPGEPGAVVSGDPTQPVEAEEMWTFMRGAGGRWLLSAIQQI
jgi:predicted lipid-binding transport protein (Tim44 family)